jgi:hypothetical protein
MRQVMRYLGRGGSLIRPRRAAIGYTGGTRRRAGFKPAPTIGIALGLVLVLLALLAAPHDAGAHTGEPERQERVKAGPYTLELRYYSVPRSGQNLLLMIVPVDGGQPTTIRVMAEPGAGVEATPAEVRTVADPDDPTATDALIPLSTTGLWVLTIEADGSAGAGEAEIGVIAAAPGAIPVPVGWAIGLSPLIGVVGFAAAQRRWMRSVHAA